jgi:hypothetical protein
MKGIFCNYNGIWDYHLDFIALLETKINDFRLEELAHFCTNNFFLWDWTPPRGRSGGILLGVNKEKFEVLDIKHGNFTLKFKLRNKEDNFQWKLIAVYGAAQENEKEAFLSELVRMCGTESEPLLLGGDFNIIKGLDEKNNTRFNER